MTDAFLLVLAALAFGAMMLPRLRRSALWRATVTPLASIIGSGFLVVAPLLADVAGPWAPVAMLGIVALAHAIGWVMRFNICHAEQGLSGAALALQRLANVALTVAYVISVAFYIRLLASFALSLSPLDSPLNETLLATAVLALIGLIGWARGLHGLEMMETVSVSLKLAIILALLAGLALFDAGQRDWIGGLEPGEMDALTRVRMLAGMLLVVQGFETSRYLGAAYPAGLRARSMRLAQIGSGAIYVVFMLLMLPLLQNLQSGPPDETAIIALSGLVAPVLPLMLILAAFMSQLSAAIADTVGAGGLAEEETRGRLRARPAYPLLIVLAIALIWAFDLFQVISIASRAFAFYYMAQALIAAHQSRGGPRRAGFLAVAAGMALIAAFALPVE